MKGGCGRGNFEIFESSELGIGVLDFGESGFFGFIGDREAGEVGERRKVGFLAVFG